MTVCQKEFSLFWCRRHSSMVVSEIKVDGEYANVEGTMDLVLAVQQRERYRSRLSCHQSLNSVQNLAKFSKALPWTYSNEDRTVSSSYGIRLSLRHSNPSSSFRAWPKLVISPMISTRRNSVSRRRPASEFSRSGCAFAKLARKFRGRWPFQLIAHVCPSQRGPSNVLMFGSPDLVLFEEIEVGSQRVAGAYQY